MWLSSSNLLKAIKGRHWDSELFLSVYSRSEHLHWLKLCLKKSVSVLKTIFTKLKATKLFYINTFVFSLSYL